MTIKELKELLEDCNDDMEILAEEPISDVKMKFEDIMNVYQFNGTIIFYIK